MLLTYGVQPCSTSDFVHLECNSDAEGRSVEEKEERTGWPVADLLLQEPMNHHSFPCHAMAAVLQTEMLLSSCRYALPATPKPS